MTKFKHFKTIQLQKVKVRLWYWWLWLEVKWAKCFGKRYTKDNLLGED